MNSFVRHQAGMAFTAHADGHEFTIDAKPEHGGEDRGPSPKVLLLTGLAGCAAMDVVAILRKMRQEPASLQVSADADLTDGHPRVFQNMRVTVTATGEVDPGKLWKAVAMSRDRYCGVAAMLGAHGPIAYTVSLNGEDLPEGA